MKVGDKVRYIKNDGYLDCNKIFTIYLEQNGHIAIYQPIPGNPIALYSAKDFVSITEIRRNKLNKINEKRRYSCLYKCWNVIFRKGR